MEKKDYARAVLEFKNATQVAPASPDAHYQLGLALLAVGDFRNAVQELIKCTELKPTHAQAQAKLAEMMATSRDPEVLAEARKRAQAAYAADPNDVAALDAMATVEWRRDSPEESEQHLTQALERMPGHLKSARMLANIKLASKDYAGAEIVLRGAVESSPKEPALRLALGGLYRFLNRPADAEQQFQTALQIDPGYAPALLQMARMRVMAGRKQEAEEFYKKVANLPDKTYRPAYALFLLYLVDANRGIAELERLNREDPANRDVRGRLVAAYFGHQRLPDAEKVLTAALAKNPRDVPALLQRAELRVSGARYDDAEQDLNKVLQYEPNTATAHLHLARVFAARGEPLRQREELGKALNLDPQSMPIRLALASEHLRTGAPKAALEILNQAPERSRNSLDYIKARNWALLGAGELAEADKSIAAGLAIANDPDLLLQSANLRFRLKDVGGARTRLETILRQSPANAAALQALTETYVSMGQASAGLARLRTAAAQQPKSAPVQMLLATWLRRARDFRGARAAATAAASADPSLSAPVLMLAELDLLEDQVEAARRRLEAIPPRDRVKPEVELLLATLEQQAGNNASAIDHLRKVVAVAPRSVVALNNLAYLLVDYANQPDEGLRFAQKVKEQAPNDDKVEDTIGWAYFAKGLYPTAILHLEAAAAKDTTSAVPKYHLAMAYQKNGEAVKARKALADAMRMDPKLPEAKRAADLIAAVQRQ